MKEKERLGRNSNLIQLESWMESFNRKRHWRKTRPNLNKVYSLADNILPMFIILWFCNMLPLEEAECNFLSLKLVLKVKKKSSREKTFSQ